MSFKFIGFAAAKKRKIYIECGQLVFGCFVGMK